MERVIPHFVVVLPVKPPAFGKSRLRGLDADQRRHLAEAFALDTATAALAAQHVGAVLVATDDPSLARRLTALGCTTIPDGDASGLNPALRQAAAEALRRWPDLVPVALCADLPALRAADLDRALGSLAGSLPAFVADAEGTGTTMYVAEHGAFDPHFGPSSRDEHQAAGARTVEGDLPSLRRDVDDLDDLHEAATLGLGQETARLYAGLVGD